ncbi:MAG: hypothetical protein KME19_25670 [Microcoleus vaginatus WJT46-NPBG5]|jgi:hypothetical protein|nr:hypothetical protein [Microcoleus vaginatus WJT46-NPBG5]
MLQEQLTPCANLLYQWILRKVPTKATANLNIKDFQAWSAEFKERPYSEREVLNAFRQLKQLELINVTKTEVTIRAKEMETFNGNKSSLANRLTSSPVKLNLYIVALLVTLILGGLKLATMSSSTASSQAQIQNLKLPNFWNSPSDK